MELTILNNMAGQDFLEALNRHVEWGIEILDLKTSILGKGLIELTVAEARAAAVEITQRGLQVYCLSSLVFGTVLEEGEESFARQHLDRVDHLISLAQIFRPTLVRLLPAQTNRRRDVTNAIAYVRQEHPWLLDLYADAIDRIHAAGFQATIENEVGGCIFSTADEILEFFAHFDRQKVSFTWDIQNLWQMGTFPGVEVYQALKPTIGYVHLKGGSSGPASREMVWRAPLEQASWPVEDVLREIVKDGVTEVICLNSSHGKKPDGYDTGMELQSDLAFVRDALTRIH